VSVPRPIASRINRVAIVDLDVHHGNGTEECVRRWQAQHPLSTHIFFFSIHLYDRQLTAIPGSDDDSDTPVDGRTSTKSEPVVRVTRARSRQGDETPNDDDTSGLGDGQAVYPLSLGEQNEGFGTMPSGSTVQALDTDPGAHESSLAAGRKARKPRAKRPSSVPVGQQATRAARKRGRNRPIEAP